MSTAAAPALETSGGSTTPSTPNTPTTDPLDAFDLTTLDSGTDLQEEYPIPDSMLLGSTRNPEAAEPEGETAESRPDGRNADGTFAKKDEKGEKVETKETPAPEPVVGSPFKYRAMGETHGLDGATVNEKGDVTIPAAKSGELREAFNALHLAKGHYAPVLEQKERRIAELTQRLTETETTQTARDAQAEQLVGLLSTAMSEPDAQKRLNQLWALSENWSTLIAKGEAEHYKNEVERLRKAPASPNAQHAPPPGTETDRSAASRDGLADVAKATTRDFVEGLKVQHDFRDISADVWKQIDAEIERRPMAYLRQATAEDVTKFGVSLGETVFDKDLVVERIVAERTQATTAREAAADQARLAADNARRTQPSVQAPPSPSGGRAAPPKKRGQGFTSKQDYEDWLNSPEL